MKTRDEAVRKIYSYVGKSTDYDHWYGAQCVDLILDYIDWLGFTPPTGNAVQWVRLPLPPGFRRYKNTPSFLPLPGDIVVWRRGVYGHIGLVVKADRRTFTSVEQNLANDLVHGSPGEIVTHRTWDNTWFIRPPFDEVTIPKKTLSPRDFIAKMKGGALKAWREYKILPSLTIAQAALETGWGKSELSQNANNLFGIKAHSGWRGKTYTISTWEHVNGSNVSTREPFRAYQSWEESILDRSKYLSSATLPQGGLRYRHVLGETDYKKACHAIKRAGYATAPDYAEVLIGIIEYNHLDEIDKAALQKSPKVTEVRVTADKLNVRSGDSTNHRIVGAVYKGDLIDIEEQKDGWGRLRGTNRWISMDYVVVV